MAEAATKLPEKKKQSVEPTKPQEWHPFESLRREIDRLFDDFGQGVWRTPLEPLWSGKLTWGTAPAVDDLARERQAVRPYLPPNCREWTRRISR